MVRVALSMDKFLELFPPTHKNYKATYKGWDKVPDLTEVQPAWFVETVSRKDAEPLYIYLGPCVGEKGERVLAAYWCDTPLENW